MAQYIKISADRVGQRIDNYLFSILKGVPKSRIYKALRKGEVRVNRSRIRPTYRLCENDELRIPPLFVVESAAPPKATSKLQKWLSGQIILENDDVIVLDKPSGLPVHGGTGQDFGVLNIIKAMRPGLPGIELVHRLDKGTSGCLVLAKKRSVLRRLHALLRERSVNKQYFALVRGRWSGGQRKAEFPLKKCLLPSGGRKVRVDYQDGLQARSFFTPVLVSDLASLMLVRIETGRTHQIRVHASKLGHPVAGDDKYGDDAFNKIFNYTIGYKRSVINCRFYLGPQMSFFINFIS